MYGNQLRQSNLNAFTLTEVAIAVAVIGILLIPLLSLLNTDIINDANLREAEIAYELAQEELEWLLHSEVPSIVLMNYFLDEENKGNQQIKIATRKKKTEAGKWIELVEVASEYETTFNNRKWTVKRTFIMGVSQITEIHVEIFTVRSPDKPVATLSTLKYN